MQKVIERSLNLLAFLLTAQRPVTADEIRVTVAGYGQQSDEAFHRTFERDKDLLRRLGVPLQLAPTDGWEVEFGYVIPGEEWALDDPGLTDEERTAVLLAAQAVRFGGQPAGADALFKLGGTPAGVAGEPLAADLGLSVTDVEAAFAAVTERRVLEFRYSGSERKIHPYGLVHRRGHWYLVGPEAARPDKAKAFRLDRAERVRAGEVRGVFQRPAGFDVADAIPQAPWEAGGDDLRVVVRFDGDVAWLARRHLTAAAEVRDLDDGGIEVTMPVASQRAFVGWLIGFDDRAEILSPPEVRAAFLELVRGAA
jgi:predicted DNA-binding transcriptional regulator YafY